MLHECMYVCICMYVCMYVCAVLEDDIITTQNFIRKLKIGLAPLRYQSWAFTKLFVTDYWEGFLTEDRLAIIMFGVMCSLFVTCICILADYCCKRYGCITSFSTVCIMY